MTKPFVFGAALLASAALAPAARAQVFPPQFVAGAVNKSLPLMTKSAGVFQDRMGKVCFSCHHQSLPSMAYAAAYEAGYKVDAAQRRRQSDYVYNFVAKTAPLLERAIDGHDAKAEKQIDQLLVDPTISMGYALYGLIEDSRQPDRTLDLATRYLAGKQAEDGRWPVWASRPPMEGSEFTTTALAVRAIRTYLQGEPSKEMDDRVARARAWLAATPAKSNEDKSYRLLGLKWAGASAEELRKGVADLLADQRDDGGWAQLPGKGSDAYATGQALVALHRGGGLPVTHSAYLRGATHLLMTQQKDGSWRVAKRAIGVQPYFESGFPHGQAQFISIGGTAWAATALALTAPAKTESAYR